MIVLRKYHFSIIFIFFSVCSFAQIRNENDTVYKFTESILSSGQTSNEPNYWEMATDFSFIGDYEEALKYGGKERRPFYDLSQKDSLYFTRFDPVDARSYILEKAKHEQVIMINEAHHFPYHRVFIASLLEDLRELGFNYYGAETINYGDSLLNQRGYPVINSGYYTVEPQFGNLVRKALNLNYKVFAYEARSPQSFEDPKEREIEQALNIYEVLQNNPDAKIIIHAGYDHIREDSMGGSWVKAMAGRFKDFSGIDPFTINQEILTERVSRELENPYYHMINIDVPSVFINDQGKVFAGPEGTNYYDVRLAHPRTEYIEGRPNWLLYDGRKHVYLDKKNLTVGYPCLLQAYKTNEDTEKAVPVDVIEIRDEAHQKPLILKPGDYTVLIKGKSETKQISLDVD